MSLGLTKPGASAALRHPKTGELLLPIGYLPNGKAIMPILGASSDDPDDPAFTGEGGTRGQDDDDEDDEEDEEEEKPRPRKSTKKSRRVDDEDEDDDEDDEEDKRPRVVRQAARYRTRLRAQEKENEDLKARLKAIEDRDRPEDEVVTRDLTEARSKIESLSEVNRIMTAQLAFFKTPAGIEWVDPSDAFALAEREGLFDDVIDEDGTVDTRELRRGLRDLAKRKKYLVKNAEDDTKARGRKSTDEDDEEEDEEPRSRRSAASMNSSRKGSKTKGPDRKELAKKFPVLNRL
jgi:hypothetical protein